MKIYVVYSCSDWEIHIDAYRNKKDWLNRYEYLLHLHTDEDWKMYDDCEVTLLENDLL